MKKKTERIVELAAEKSVNKRLSVLRAIDLMKNENININFTSVSKQAGVSRNYLYKNDELRNLIEILRIDKIKKVQSKDAKDIIIETQKRKIAELNKELKKYDSYDKVEERYKKALEEIEKLKEQLKKAYKY